MNEQTMIEAMDTLNDVERAIKNNGKPYRVCAGIYYVYKNSALYVITDEGGLWSVVVSGNEDAIGRDYETLRECLNVVDLHANFSNEKTHAMNGQITAQGVKERTAKLLKEALQSPGKSKRFSAGVYFIHNGVNMFKVTKKEANTLETIWYVRNMDTSWSPDDFYHTKKECIEAIIGVANDDMKRYGAYCRLY